MLRWPLVIVILQIPVSFGASSSTGPTSPEEARTLWREGQKAFQHSSFNYALNHFQRLVDRYPGDSHALEAHLFLGDTLLELNQPTKAISPLKYFIEATGQQPSSVPARLSLGSAYLKLKKFHEAYLLALELEAIQVKTPLPFRTEIKTRLFKVQTLIELKHYDAATDLVHSIENQLLKANHFDLNSTAFHLDLKLKTIECAQLGIDPSLSENQIQDQLERRGTCLFEALLTFHKLLKTKETHTAETAQEDVLQGFELYKKACASPPLPSSSALSKKPVRMQKQYQLELADHLTQEYRKKTEEAVELLGSWKTKVPESTSPVLNRLSESLQKLISRAP